MIFWIILVVIIVVVVEIFAHGAVSAKQMSLQQLLELADCRVGLTQ